VIEFEFKEPNYKMYEEKTLKLTNNSNDPVFFKIKLPEDKKE